MSAAEKKTSLRPPPVDIGIIEPSTLLAEGLCELLASYGFSAKSFTSHPQAKSLLVNWSSAHSRRMAFPKGTLVVAYGQPMTAPLALHALDHHVDCILADNQGVDALLDVLATPRALSSPALSRRVQVLRERRKHAATLTAREIEVLEALVVFNSAAALAESLKISPHTLRNHRASIYNKLHTSSRFSTLEEARELGLIV